MDKDQLKQYMLDDNYIEISFKRYLAFKKSDGYDESYKYEILPRINYFLKGQEINEFTIVEIVKKLRKENPASGSFVHWSEMGNLVKYVEDRPAEIADLLNELYMSGDPVNERIERFRASARQYNPSIALGAPLFSFLLAAKDSRRYPIYKQEVFTSVKSSFGIDAKLGGVGDNYELYLSMAEIAQEHLSSAYPELGLTMLDMQDYFFCATQYDEIMVESSFRYLHRIAADLSLFINHPAEMLAAIARFDGILLRTLRERYHKHEKINRIKFEVLEKIIETGGVTIDDLEVIKDNVKARYDTNILKSWDNFKILFQLYYAKVKLKVEEALRKIHASIRGMEAFQGMQFDRNKVINGFDWNQNFGTDECWLAVFEDSHESHRTAPQLFVSIKEHEIRYGLLYGDQHPNRGQQDLSIIQGIDQFTYDAFQSKMTSLAASFKHPMMPENPTSNEGSQGDPSNEISIATWIELLQNKDIFKAGDLVYIHQMYEMGGQASATELAAALRRHFSSFNAPVVQLAKRIRGFTGSPPALREDGTEYYWGVLFDGEYQDNGHFRWRLKPNLYAAVAFVYPNLNNDDDSPVYTKDDFLNEVFMDGSLYDTLTGLLSYKKNLILQGPPGVGKTFVSKRLAYALLGKKDEQRVEIVQFHQNYAYEDFVMGYRPKENGFQLEYGIFYEFCERAIRRPENDFYFIIDEINRGNLSKIFGELFMLIEKDKRDEFVTMGYSKKKFTVPANVYLIGTMNTADRSLSQIEIALRRRFAFATLEPAFNEKWRHRLAQSGVSDALISHIQESVARVNQEITSDYQLGSGYIIGHSFFGDKPDYLEEKAWYSGVIRYEIAPLLEEYYYERPEVAKSLIEELQYGIGV